MKSRNTAANIETEVRSITYLPCQNSHAFMFFFEALPIVGTALVFLVFAASGGRTDKAL